MSNWESIGNAFFESFLKEVAKQAGKAAAQSLYQAAIDKAPDGDLSGYTPSDLELVRDYIPSKVTFLVKLINEPQGLDKVIEVSANEYILDAAERNGVDLPYSCKLGGCSSCAALLVKGGVDQFDQSFLDDDQVEDGFILTCISYPVSHCEVLTHMEEALY